MNRFEQIQTMNMQEFAKWMDKYCDFDGSPWVDFFSEEYCDKCDPIMCRRENSKVEFSCAWCEIHNNCKFFSSQEFPSMEDMILMWLQEKVM